MGISVSDYRALCARMHLDPITASDAPKEKYGRKKMSLDGVQFDSTREARVYQQLKIEEQAGIISDLKLQPVFLLQAAFRDEQGVHHRAITYRADFQYETEGKTVVCDVKGVRTEPFRIKRKMFAAKYPHLEFREIR